jgi:hypothetical protein
VMNAAMARERSCFMTAPRGGFRPPSRSESP